ncbi:hypothetical protein ACPTE9_30065, partial [Pseudomonas aeruginosa]|uniref:hypothetical protein n=1 Tax=Pseudomonas aeruginosa TaxID=287 RepID=UPI003CC6CF37
PMPMVNTKKPNRKIAILVIRPPKGRGATGMSGWRHCPLRRHFDTGADRKEKTVSDGPATLRLRGRKAGGFLKISH